MMLMKDESASIVAAAMKDCASMDFEGDSEPKSKTEDVKSEASDVDYAD